MVVMQSIMRIDHVDSRHVTRRMWMTSKAGLPDMGSTTTR